MIKECEAYQEKRRADIEARTNECEAYRKEREADSEKHRKDREADSENYRKDREADAAIVDKQIELERLRRTPLTRPASAADAPARKRPMHAHAQRYDVAASVLAQPGARRE